MKNIFRQVTDINREDREIKNQYKSCAIWFTGLSGSGKSSLANELEKRLFHKNIKSYILDGDNMRLGLNSDLTFSDKDRKENIRRIAEVSNLFIDAGVICISAFISPFKEDRDLAKKIIGEDRFIEVYVSTPIETCEKRDPKGLYAKARKGEIINFTGIDSAFEIPQNPRLKIDTTDKNNCDSIDELMKIIQQYL